MPGWLDYVSDLTDIRQGHNLDRVCIIQLDGQRWVASDNSIKPDRDQIGQIYAVLHSRVQNNETIVVGDRIKRTFHVNRNNGKFLQARGGKQGMRNEVLCVSLVRNYLVLGGVLASKDSGQCRIELEYISRHLAAS